MTANIQPRPDIPNYPPYLPAVQELAAERVLAGRQVTPHPAGVRTLPTPPPRADAAPSQSSGTGALVDRLKAELVLLKEQYPGMLPKVGIGKSEYAAILANPNSLTAQQFQRIGEIFEIIERLKREYNDLKKAKTASPSSIPPKITDVVKAPQTRVYKYREVTPQNEEDFGRYAYTAFYDMLSRHCTTVVPLAEDQSNLPCYIGADSSGKLFSVRVDTSFIDAKINECWEIYRRDGKKSPSKEAEAKRPNEIATVVKSALKHCDMSGTCFSLFFLAVCPQAGVSENRQLPVRIDPTTGQRVCMHNKIVTPYTRLSKAEICKRFEPYVMDTRDLFYRFVAAELDGSHQFFGTAEYQRINYPLPVEEVSEERYYLIPYLEKVGKTLMLFMENLVTIHAVHSYAYFYRSDLASNGLFVSGTYDRRVPKYMDLVCCKIEQVDPSEAALGAVGRVALLSLDLLERAELPHLGGDLTGLKSKDVLEVVAALISRGNKASLVAGRLMYLTLKKRCPTAMIWAGDEAIRENLKRIDQMTASQIRDSLLEIFQKEPMQSLILKIWQQSSR